MENLTRADKQDLINAALDHVFTDEASDEAELIKQVAGEHALINMGQTLLDHFPCYSRPQVESLLYTCFNNLYQQSESDEMADGIMQEYRFWVKRANKSLAKVKKAKLALTPRNLRDAYLCEGAFAKK